MLLANSAFLPMSRDGSAGDVASAVHRRFRTAVPPTSVTGFAVVLAPPACRCSSRQLVKSGRCWRLRAGRAGVWVLRKKRRTRSAFRTPWGPVRPEAWA